MKRVSFIMCDFYLSKTVIKKQTKRLYLNNSPEIPAATNCHPHPQPQAQAFSSFPLGKSRWFHVSGEKATDWTKLMPTI